MSCFSNAVWPTKRTSPGGSGISETNLEVPDKNLAESIDRSLNSCILGFERQILDKRFVLRLAQVRIQLGCGYGGGG